MINQKDIDSRRVVICNGCNCIMSPCGTWPLDQKEQDGKLILVSDKVATQYWCETDTCKVVVSTLKRKDGSPYMGKRCVKVLEPDLYTGPCTDPAYDWEISPR